MVIFILSVMYLVQFRPMISLLKYQIYRQHKCLYIRVVQNLKFKCECELITSYIGMTGRVIYCILFKINYNTIQKFCL